MNASREPKCAALAVGVDLVEIRRVAALAERYGERFKGRVFTQAERTDCGDRPESLAARWAAKEAVAKALGTGISGGMTFREIEVVRDADGRPGIRLYDRARRGAEDRGVGRIHVSLTHTLGRAAAVVILETGEGSG